MGPNSGKWYESSQSAKSRRSEASNEIFRGIVGHARPWKVKRIGAGLFSRIGAEVTVLDKIFPAWKRYYHGAASTAWPFHALKNESNRGSRGFGKITFFERYRIAEPMTDFRVRVSLVSWVCLLEDSGWGYIFWLSLSCHSTSPGQLRVPRTSEDCNNFLPKEFHFLNRTEWNWQLCNYFDANCGP